MKKERNREMNEPATPSAFGVLTDPATLKI